MTPIKPTCEKCGHVLVRAHSRGGKGQLTCPNIACPDSFKKWIDAK